MCQYFQPVRNIEIRLWMIMIFAYLTNMTDMSFTIAQLPLISHWPRGAGHGWCANMPFIKLHLRTSANIAHVQLLNWLSPDNMQHSSCIRPYCLLTEIPPVSTSRSYFPFLFIFYRHHKYSHNILQSQLMHIFILLKCF